jgi:hypothetical protein
MTDCRGCGHVDCICEALDHARAMIGSMADEISRLKDENLKMRRELDRLAPSLAAHHITGYRFGGDGTVKRA